MERLTVRVPATSANLGSGFDCLGMALEMHNVVRASPADRTTVSIRGEGAERLAPNERNLIYRSVGAVFGASGQKPPPLAIECTNTIPVARGLGSSSSAIAAGLLIGNRLAGKPLDCGEVIALGAELEGHADNIVACLLGGVKVCVRDGAVVHTANIPVPADLRVVLYIPDFPMRTEQARAVLPRNVPLTDAVFNVGRACLLVAALANGRLDQLRVATEDALHQGPRSRIFPALPQIISAALDAGAHGAFLSGAGSAVLALVSHSEAAVASAMEFAGAQSGISGRTECLSIAREGARIEVS